MSTIFNTPPPNCSTKDCSRCPLGELEQAARDREGRIEGWPLALAAGLVFILPLALAMAGAMLAGGEGVGQAAGAAAGFAFGILLARLFARSLPITKEPS